MGNAWGRSPPWAEGDATPPPRCRVSRRKRSLEEGSEEEVEELSPKRSDSRLVCGTIGVRLQQLVGIVILPGIVCGQPCQL